MKRKPYVSWLLILVLGIFSSQVVAREKCHFNSMRYMCLGGNDAGKRSESNRNLLDILRSSRGHHLPRQHYNNRNLPSLNLKRPWRLLSVQNMGRILQALSPEATLEH